MKQLEKVQNNTTWAKASNAINNNNDALYVAVTTLEHAAFKNKGYFKSVALLYGAYPTAENGAQAFVYNSSNPTSAPYDIYEWVNNAWQDSGVNGGNVNVNLDSKQDTLVGYSESVSGGKATQVAIQGDTIALSGKVSLGNVDDMESAILMSSSQAVAAVAKANAVEQSMSALKSPVKPLHLNSQGKLELNIGKGLYIEDGKLCTTGASGGGGGCGTTYSEGQGISIYNDQISVAYNVEALTIDDCGGLSVNYGEGLTIKNGKLSAQTSVNAGNGLVKKGDALQVSVGTGLLVADDVYVNLGKGLATDNENKVNVNLDEQTLTTDSSGKVIVKKDGLIGNGLKQEYSKLAVNYGTGLTLSNKAIVVNYGTGLSIQDGKLVSTAQGGKTYREGQAIDISGNNEISVKYDGVTISTKDTTDNSLHVMLGNGLRQGANGIDVVVGSGLAIDCDNQLYSTVSEGQTYTAGDGISISDQNNISFKLGTSLESVCGYIQVAISSGLEYDPYNEYKIRVKAGDGIIIPHTGEVKAHIGNGLKFGTHGVIEVDNTKFQYKLTFGTGLSLSNNKIYVDTSKIAGSGIDLDDDRKTLTIGTKAAQVLAGSGLKQVGQQLVVDAENLRVGHASFADYTPESCSAQYALYAESAANAAYAITACSANYANSAGKATSDINGNAIHNTYISKSLVGKEGIEIRDGSLAISTGKGINVVCDKVVVHAGNGIAFNSEGKLTISLHEKSGLNITSEGLGVNAGVALGTSDGKLNVLYGTGLSVNSGNQIYVDTSKIAGSGIDLDDDRKTLTIGTKAAQALAGAGLMADGQRMKVKYGSGLTTNTCGGLIVDAAKLSVGNSAQLSGNSIGAFMTFANMGGNYVGASFNDSTLSKIAGEKYIEFGDGTGGWFNGNWGKVTAHCGFIGNLTGTADTAGKAGAMNIVTGAQQDECVPAEFDSMQIFRVNGIDGTNTGGGDGWILSFRWPYSGYLTQIYIDVDDTHIMSMRHRRSNSTWTEWKRVAFTDQIIARVTNGLAINCDRVLSMPNLTASVVNGAVDGSKNGAQRVLNLSCGAIQIKLSTGLAIDDSGYLYIQDKYVTK